jgi:hypothetical protein
MTSEPFYILLMQEGVHLLEETAWPVLPHLLLNGKEYNDASFGAYPLLPKLHRTPHTQVILPQNPLRYVPTASSLPAIVEALRTLHALGSLTVGNYGNSVHTDPPVFAYPSSNIVHPEDQTSSPVLDVRPMRHNDAPVSIVNVTDLH